MPAQTAIAPTKRSRSPERIKFDGDKTFQQYLNDRVERYFRMTRQSPRDCPRMYLKTAVILTWFVASYSLLVFWASTLWVALPLAVSLGLALSAIGFSIQHDGGHHAYSRHKSINKIASMMLDLIGGSSFIWARKHNGLHHTYSNISDHDDDINVGLLARLSPNDKRLPFHRWQHFYLWLLYGFLAIKWHIVDDFVNVIRGKIGQHKLERPHGWDLIGFIGGKLAFFAVAFVVPSLVHPIWLVIVGYLFVAWIIGLVLSVVFQLAHVVQEAAFPAPDAETGRITKSWAEHQIETTVDFARHNPAVSWFVGGLNFQVEHHLFPRICHIHYPKISRIVEKACARANIQYNAHANVMAGVRSHFLWLREMGKATT